ncbi:MAG: B12-binding domain-containing radical SAM protein, partial [Desulfobacterales bacterium CG23_combo_of_CG06-09_8_20_14_all_52_9]
AVVPSLTEAPFPFNPVVPFGKPIHDRLRLEIARGCTRGCRFCQAGILYRPVRERSPDDLLNMAQNSLAATGYDNISLLSLSTGDYTAIGYLMEKLMGRCEDQKVAISLPSVRAGTLTPKLMQLIQRVRKTGFTIAPEAGSQRLRDIVNKNLTDAEIIETVQNAFELGWQVIKLYFMVGLPFEIDADIKALVDLVQKLNSSGVRKKGKGRGTLHVSVATFIPKPHTPFQWAPQIPLEASREKIVCLKRVLNRPGIQFKWQNPEVSLLEGLWARGDRRLSSLL